jgi:hypothetical protein
LITESSDDLDAALIIGTVEQQELRTGRHKRRRLDAPERTQPSSQKNRASGEF